MDMDDDFASPPEFNLSEAQKDTVQRAVSIAVKVWTDIPDADDFAAFNPLIVILEWWKANVPEDERATGSPETILADACACFVAAHEMPG
jgi:hypothetical protein